ncbi:MAG: UDP-N-acetylmuramoylalanine--D-glutamate ligase [Alphaproteobacteria bacterium 33-17]|nr:MAG: UDP-N-acetylmuramoylalanine--D-glutamate ligase [Alphaproteobacteria bacterium 33-17]
MINLDFYKGKSFFVYGLGRTGISAVNALLKSNINVKSWDEKASSINLPDHIRNTLESPETTNWKNTDYLVLSPGVPLTFPEPHYIVNFAKSAGTTIYSDIEMLFHSQKKNKFIGITGTNGKSTTTSLTHYILSHSKLDTQIGGNIGIPVMDLNPFQRSGNFVLEMSSFQLDLLHDVKFNTAAILNVTKDHLDRHGNMDHYINAKTKIFDHQTMMDNAIFAIDNPITLNLYQNLPLKSYKVPVSSLNKNMEFGVYVGEDHIQFNVHNHKGDIQFSQPKNLPGKHNRENIAVAFAIGMLYNLSPENILQAINSFSPLPHRLEYLGQMLNMSFYNDSKSTNAEASIAALSSFSNIYWILGGQPKEGGLEALRPYLSNVHKAYLIGSSQDEFANFLKSEGVSYSKCGTLENAFTDAALDAKSDLKHANIVLSPACASFDQFKSFEHRGEEFRRIFEYYNAQSL